MKMKIFLGVDGDEFDSRTELKGKRRALKRIEPWCEI